MKLATPFVRHAHHALHTRRHAMHDQGAGVCCLSLCNSMQVLEAPLDRVCHNAWHADPTKVLKRAAFL